MWSRLTNLLSNNNQNNSSNNNNNNPSLTTPIKKPESSSPDITDALPVDLWKTLLPTKDKNAREVSIGFHLSSRDKNILSQTRKKFYFLYQEEAPMLRSQINTLFSVKNDQPYDREDLHKLLSHADVAEWEQAEAIWSKDPSLLTRSGTIYHPNRCYQDAQGKPLATPIDIPLWQNPGRPKIIGTAWQIALMNEEYEEAEKMGEKMTHDEKVRQFYEIFPTGKIEHDEAKLQKAKELLDAVFDAVTHDQTIDENNLEKMNDKTRQALSDLYAFLNPVSEHKTGLVFDVNIYLYAFSLYEKQFNQFTQSNQWDQRSFWCIRIEEYMAHLLPLAYLRPHAQGIGNVNVNDDKSIKRDGCKLADGSSYFSFRRPSDSIPGLSHFVGYYGARVGLAYRPLGCVAAISKLMSNKNEIKDRIMQQYSCSAASSLGY